MKQGWTYKTLGDVAEFSRGLTYSKKDEVEFSDNIVLRSNNIDLKTGKLVFDELKYLRPDFEIPLEKRLKKGSLFICMSNGSKIHLGKVAYINEDFGYAYGGFMGQITPCKEIDGHFLHYFLSSPRYKDYIKSLSAGANINNLKFKDLALFEIGFPPLAEQERIVERLDGAFAQIDELKSNAERQLAEARALFQSALTQAMQPKPGWQEKTLVNVCDIFGRIGFRGYTTKDLVSSQNDGAISLSPSNIQNGEMDYSKRTYISWFKYNESPEIKIFNGDILLVKTGSSYGKSALVKDLPHEATINPQSVVLKNFRINNEFFAYQLRTERVKKEFDQFVSGTAIPTFSQAKLGTVPIYFPGEIEQEQIVSYLNSLNNNVKDLEEINRKTAAECDAMKQALLRQGRGDYQTEED